MADKWWVISLVEFFVSSKIWLASLLLGNGLDTDDYIYCYFLSYLFWYGLDSE